MRVPPLTINLQTQNNGFPKIPEKNNIGDIGKKQEQIRQFPWGRRTHCRAIKY
jgi:hypothetical protein